MAIVVVANGEISDSASAERLLAAAEEIIAADGGCRHCLSLGFPPDLLIGDLDSVSEADLAAVKAAGGNIERHPRRKDATDLELALGAIADRGGGTVTLLGTVGGRWDQSLASFLLLTNPGFRSLSIDVIDGQQRARLIRPGEEVRLAGELGDTVSLLPLGGDAHGISSEGLEYSLKDETLHYGSTRGVSNIIAKSEPKVKLRRGFLLAVIIRANGI